MQDPDSVGEQTGIGQSPEPADATVYGPLHVTTDTRRPELIEGQQRQHLTEQTTNNQVLTNVRSVSNLLFIIIYLFIYLFAHKTLHKMYCHVQREQDNKAQITE